MPGLRRLKVFSLIALAAGSLLLLGTPARAYDLGDCNQLLATDAMQQFTMHGENVDFAADLMVSWGTRTSVRVPA